MDKSNVIKGMAYSYVQLERRWIEKNDRNKRTLCATSFCSSRERNARTFEEEITDVAHNIMWRLMTNSQHPARMYGFAIDTDFC